MQSIPLEGPADVAALEAFLTSDQAPDDCMTLSELDGFLAGIIASPDLVPPSEWLDVIWGEGDPKFHDLAQANAFLGNLMRRYTAITAQLDADPPAYDPILATTDDGKPDGSDWGWDLSRRWPCARKAGSRWRPMRRPACCWRRSC